MTDREKAVRFSQLLNRVPSLLTICLSKDCTLAEDIREQYPDMITLEWVRSIRDLTINDYGVSGTLAFGAQLEFVYVPWRAIVDLRMAYERPVAPAPAPPRLRLIRGGKWD